MNFVVGQSEDGHVIGVIHAADDDGEVWIALEETDSHFVTDAGDTLMASLVTWLGTNGTVEPTGRSSHQSMSILGGL